MKNTARSWSRLGRLFCFVLAILGLAELRVAAQQSGPPATTVIQDVVYRADGSPAHGNLQISWPAFTTADGNAVAAGSLNMALGPSGALSLALVPNENATPAGTFYKVLIQLDDGTVSTEYWTVPSASPVNVAGI